ncbi:site-specific integrase [Algoriphagus lacus]|uniref:Site-specific integrase n=1 Tax=Algoriphagus lacus TaxID=2056311 RepID=A0A418PN20_9BACT|nr:site-specific integrase [Algoriphagus lacus]RIW12900.1 site-specific integrase [Algoriphagus lacus]
MIEKSFRITFFLKARKNSNDELHHLFLRITVNGESREISTKLDWSKKRWNSKAGLALGSKEDALRLNAYLDSIRMKVMQARLQLMEKGKDVTADSVRNVLLGESEENQFLLEIFKRHNDHMESLVGSEFAPGTLERYKTSYDHTKAYIRWKFGKDDLEIKKLDYEFISDYEYWFKSVRKCSHNTTVKYLANMKKIVLDCVKRGWLIRDPFMNYKLVKKEVHREALTEEELDKIAKRVFSTDRLNQIRDIFIFSCYTGLAYVDVKNLRQDQLINGIDGEKWLVTHRQKTQAPTRLPLLPEALKIIHKYQNHPVVKITGKVLPTPSNQKTNAYLKEIADLCGINKELTFHIARHTFATTITLANGVPLETVSKMLGHKSLAQTQHYAKILDNKVSEEMKSLKEILNSKAKVAKPSLKRKPRF